MKITDAAASDYIAQLVAAGHSVVDAADIVFEDSEHWITTENGEHLLIEGESGNYTVKGGAGGKLNGTKVSPSSMSPARGGGNGNGQSASPQPAIPEGHERLHRPQKIERETEKAFGLSNPHYAEAKELHEYGGTLEVMRRGSPQAREAWQNRQSLTWVPKSHSSAHEGHVVSMSGWLAKKTGLGTVERTERKEVAFASGKQRYEELLEKAKALGVPVRSRMKTSTIKEKMRAAGHAVDRMARVHDKCGCAVQHGTVIDQSVHAPERISESRSMTPEGFMLCAGVPIARTGSQQYADGEVPADGNGSGVVMVDRLEEEVFRPETLASFEGKPVTIGHPDEFVGPSNFRDLACGVVLNVRRGDGIHSNYMVADLLITTQDAIATIQQNGIREVSCGYEADYEQGVPGRAVQRNIVGNHVALVARGRCGTSCAIGDEDMAKKLSFADRIRHAFRSKDENEAEKLAKEAEDAAEEEEEEKADKQTADAFRVALDAALKPIRDDIEALKKAGEANDDDDDDKKEKTDDVVLSAESAAKLDMAGVKLYTGDAAKDIARRAEILSPGIRMPTMDAKTNDAARVKAMCDCQRKALDAAYATEDGRAAIDPFLAGRTFDQLSNGCLHSVFVGASELMRVRNNGSVRATVATRDIGKAVTNDSINERNRKFWAERQVGR